MLVKDMMTRDVITVSADMSLKELGKLFKEKRISGVPVEDSKGDLAGIVTLTDLLRILDHDYKWKQLETRLPGLKTDQMQEGKLAGKVKDIMSHEIFSISEDGTLEDLMRMMFSKGVHTIPVLKEGKIIGIVGKRDLIETCF